MNNIRIKHISISTLLATLLLGGCATIHIEPKELAVMDAYQVIQTLAKKRPIQIAWRGRVIESIERIDTANFTAYQTHYVAASVPDNGKDYIAAKLVKSYCDAKGGIYPDQTFGAANPHGSRIDCMSLSSGKLLFSVFTAKSSKFPLITGGEANYNLVAIAVPKGGRETDPATEYQMTSRDLPHNYFLDGTINMLALGRK